MIEVEALSKRYGRTEAVTELTFTVVPGVVTGFLGPNGAAKSTTMRLVAGLEAPSAGRVLVNGRRYREAAAPMRELVVLLEARAAHPARSARDHLLALAQTHGLPTRRVDQVLEMVGLGAVADGRVGGFSLGMANGWALSLCSAIRATVMLDEPVNGETSLAALGRCAIPPARATPEPPPPPAGPHTGALASRAPPTPAPQETSITTTTTDWRDDDRDEHQRRPAG